MVFNYLILIITGKNREVYERANLKSYSLMSTYLYKSMLADHKGKKTVYLLIDLIFNEAQGPKKELNDEQGDT